MICEYLIIPSRQTFKHNITISNKFSNNISVDHNSSFLVFTSGPASLLDVTVGKEPMSPFFFLAYLSSECPLAVSSLSMAK